MARLMMGYQGPYGGAPTVNYPRGDYRKISKLDRSRAEAAKNAELEYQISQNQRWRDVEFAKKLEELQRGLASVGGSAVGGSTSGGGGVSFAPQQQGGGAETAMDRMSQTNPELMKYLELLRSARMVTGPNANPYALGYNFGTLTGRGGYFGKAAPVPELPGDIASLLKYGQSGTAPVSPQAAGRSPGWATYRRPEIPPEVLAQWGR